MPPGPSSVRTRDCRIDQQLAERAAISSDRPMKVVGCSGRLSRCCASPRRRASSVGQPGRMNLVDVLRGEIAKAMLAQVAHREHLSGSCCPSRAIASESEDLPAIRRRQQASQPVETGGAVVTVRLGIDLAGVQRHADPWRRG